MRALLAFLAILLGTVAQAEENPALGLRMELAARVPFRVEALPGKWQVRLAYRNLEPARLITRPGLDPRILAVSPDRAPDGWRAYVFDLAQGFDLVSAGLGPDRVLRVSLRPVPGGATALRDDRTDTDDHRPLIVLDPGHGGIDSGAVRQDLKESDLMLLFARELGQDLIRTGRFRVALTREDDRFLRLSERIDFAREAGADAFISLHADALEEGQARGAAVFTLSRRATSATAAELVEAHDRADALRGGALEGADDEIAALVIELAQRQTGPGSRDLAAALVAALQDNNSELRKRARQSAAFGVLKSPDIPSVLVELGFMSDAEDLKNLADPGWRSQVSAAIRDGIIVWADGVAKAGFGR